MVGAVVSQGIPGKNAKSFAYDVRDYIQPETIPFCTAVSASSVCTFAGGGTGGNGFTSFTQKQMRSITVVPAVGTVGAAQADYWVGTLYTLQPQNFNIQNGTAISGTFTLASCFPVNGGLNLNSAGTSTATSVSRLIFTGTNPGGTTYYPGGSNYLAFPAVGTNQGTYQPWVAVLDGGTCTVVGAGPNGTWTNTAYTFPTGPNGGLSLNPGDVFNMTKGTDTSVAYLGEIELTYTPGTTFTI